MKNLLLAALCVAATLSASAQGTVNFANIGGGVNAPVTGPDGLLGAGFTAQLQLADGTNVGDPANFLANGLFSGGTRTVAPTQVRWLRKLRCYGYTVWRGNSAN